MTDPTSAKANAWALRSRSEHPPRVEIVRDKDGAVMEVNWVLSNTAHLMLIGFCLTMLATTGLLALAFHNFIILGLVLPICYLLYRDIPRMFRHDWGDGLLANRVGVSFANMYPSLGIVPWSEMASFEIVHRDGAILPDFLVAHFRDDKEYLRKVSPKDFRTLAQSRNGPPPFATIVNVTGVETGDLLKAFAELSGRPG